MGILGGNPKDEPLHYGEIFSIWEFSMAAKGCLSSNRAFMYHAGDKELKKLIEDFIQQAELEIRECDAILTANGFVPHPALPERPEASTEDIPAGARFTDPEIAAQFALSTSAGLVACSQIIGMAIREDIAALFVKYHTVKVALGARVLRMSKEKGWLVPPPLQIKRPESVPV